MMKKSYFFAFSLLLFSSCSGITPLNKESEVIPPTSEKVIDEKITEPSNKELCLKSFETISEKRLTAEIKNQLCQQVLPNYSTCKSNEGRHIFHYDKLSKKKKAKKILVFATFHGDETEASVVAAHWIKRLEELDSRNSWRIIPLLNPDGALRKTRMNAKGIDLNRNFPSKDWDKLAKLYWKTKTKSNKRRYPGEAGGSEPETQCAISHINDYKPDFVIALHTPYGLLDFDGPKLNLPSFDHLRWHSLGTFPGSLGRYLWVDRKIPVLTVELKANDSILNLPEKMDSLQDLSGKAAILANKYLNN